MAETCWQLCPALGLFVPPILSTAGQELGSSTDPNARHALMQVTPVIGQGCNSALEDCEVLDSVLESTGKLSGMRVQYSQQAATQRWSPKVIYQEVGISRVSRLQLSAGGL